MHPSISQLFDLAGQVALVTGGASKLGLDAARILAAAGADVIVTSRSLDKAQDAAAGIAREFGVGALGLALDTAESGSISALAAASAGWRNGRLDILVNNAGGGSGSSVATLFDRDPAEIDRMIGTNLTAVLHVTREVGRAMMARQSGTVINIASIAALVGRDRRIYERPGLLGQPVDYAAAKAGILGMTRDLAALVAPSGIRVNAISPGGFERPEMDPAFVADYADRTPLGRMGRDGHDLNGAILFLASQASAYVTGQNLVVDGGFSIFR